MSPTLTTRTAVATGMGRRATERLPIRPDTKDLIDEAKADGETYDLWVRREALGLDE